MKPMAGEEDGVTQKRYVHSLSDVYKEMVELCLAALIYDKLVGSFRVKDGVKMTALTYITFLKEYLLPWYKKKSMTFRNEMVFMLDNAPSHAAHLTTDFLKKVLVKKDEIMEWPACSPDLNGKPMEHF